MPKQRHIKRQFDQALEDHAEYVTVSVWELDELLSASTTKALRFIAEASPAELLHAARKFSEPLTIKRLERGYTCNFRVVSEYRGAVVSAMKDVARHALGERGLP